MVDFLREKLQAPAHPEMTVKLQAI
jgi:hypothetical protein